MKIKRVASPESVLVHLKYRTNFKRDTSSRKVYRKTQKFSLSKIWGTNITAYREPQNHSTLPIGEVTDIQTRWQECATMYLIR